MNLNWGKIILLTLVKIIIFGLFFFGGLGIGFIFNDFPFIVLKKDVSLGDIASFVLAIANFILAIVAALWIPFFLNRKITSKRVEKDMLMDSCHRHEKEQLNELEKLVSKTHLKIKPITKAEAGKIILVSKRVSSRLSLLLDDVLSYCNGNEVCEIADTLVRDQSSLWIELTTNLGGSRPKITTETYRKTDQNIYTYLGHLSKLRVVINNI